MANTTAAADAEAALAGHNYNTRHRGKPQDNGESQQAPEC
jgi:hypothetical protein